MLAEDRDLVDVFDPWSGCRYRRDRGVTVHHEETLAFALEIVGSLGRGLVEVRLVAVDLHVHRDRAFGGDWGSRELELRSDGVWTPWALIWLNGMKRALLMAGVAVVEGQDSRARHDAEENARFGGREPERCEVVVDRAERECRSRTALSGYRSRLAR